MSLYKVNTLEVASLVNPLKGETWNCEPINPQEVDLAIEKRNFNSEPWSVVKNEILEKDFRDYHIARIAHLVAHGFDLQDPQNKAALCVMENCSWFYDGNHRFAAALVKGTTEVTIVIVGDKDLIAQKLPSAMPL